MAVHDGHRDRMRERIVEYGTDSLRDHEVLEFLLYSFVPRRNTNEIAHDLIKAFGSLTSVFDATVERLEKVKGMSHNSAVFLSNMGDVSRRYISHDRESTIYIGNAHGCAEYMTPILSTKTREEVHMLIANSSGMLTKHIVLDKGIVNESHCNVRAIADIALNHEAVSIVLAHNHPSGKAKPSIADIDMTKRLYVSLNGVGVKLTEHVIITSNSYYSFFEDGVLDKLKNSIVSIVGGKIHDVEY